MEIWVTHHCHVYQELPNHDYKLSLLDFLNQYVAYPWYNYSFSTVKPIA